MHASWRSLASLATLATAIGAGLLAAACGGGGSGSFSNASLVTLTTTSVPAGLTGQPYSAQLSANFPHPPGQFVVSAGRLPPGLELDNLTGAITGFPRQLGRFNFDISARDGIDPSLPPNRDSTYSEAVRSYALDVSLGTPSILPQVMPAAQYRHSFLYQVVVAGGTPPYDFALTGGTLPAGITLSQSGQLGNFPTQANVSPGVPFEFDVQVTDAQNKTDSAHFALNVVVLPLIILTSAVNEGAQNFPYDAKLELASSGGGQPITWSQVAPGVGEVALSTIGMEITADGHLRNVFGTPGPSSIGTFKFTVQVTDEAAQVSTRQFTLKVNPGPVLTSISPNRGAIPGPYVVNGANFQPGATLVFKPGPTEVTVTPAFVSSTQLRFNTAPAAPGGGGVAVKVVNPDSGSFTKPGAFVFPASTVSFGTKGFVTSSVSSTGLDCADVDGDGFADVIHSGASGISTYSGSLVSQTGGLLYHHNLGTVPVTFSTQTLDAGNYYDCKFADVNSDGKLDIVALGQSQIRVWLNGVSGNLLGTFSSVPGSTHASGFSYPMQMTIGKFNADALPDVAFGVGYYPNGGASGRVYTMIGNGAGSFTLVGQATTSITNSYGVVALAATDTDGDGRDEVVAGVGMGYDYQGPLFNYNVTTSTGDFSGWQRRGTVLTPYYYGTTTAVATGDFNGTGSKDMIGVMVGAPNYIGGQSFFMFSGAGLTSSVQLSNPGGDTKAIGLVDADFDTKQDWALSTRHTGLEIWTGAARARAVSLDVSAGSPGVSTPKTGRVAGGDLDGDGRADVLVTTSYWTCEGMGAWQNYYYYELGLIGDGASRGFAFYLNTSN